MKRYSDLSILQKDFAVDKALVLLVNRLVSDDFDYEFKSILAQKQFNDALMGCDYFEIEAAVLASDEIAEELYPIAESMAETAYYPNADEYIIQGISV